MAAANDRKTLTMVAWAGLGFAIKAQAIFIAPFALAIVVRERRWLALPISPAIYLLAIAPAWLAGWPLPNLLTIYSRQYESIPWLSTAPNVWALPQLLISHPPYWLFVLGYSAAFVAAGLYVRKFRGPAINLALLSAMMVPWLLPRIHERYFLLADVLALAAAFADRRAVPIFISVQVGSLFALAAYIYVWMPFIVFGSVFMTTGLVLLCWQIYADCKAEASGAADLATAPPCNPHRQSRDANGIVLGP